MGNVLDYVRREFRGFAELPFGDVDSLVLSELSYMRLTDLVPTFGEAKSVATVPIRELLRAESYDEMFVSNSSDMNDYRLALLHAVCESPRFRALRVGEYAERLSERVRRGLRFTRLAVYRLPRHRRHACRMEGGFQYGSALSGTVTGIRVSVCGFDSGQVGRFPVIGRIACDYAWRPFERWQHGRICGHAGGS